MRAFLLRLQQQAAVLLARLSAPLPGFLRTHVARVSALVMLAALLASTAALVIQRVPAAHAVSGAGFTTFDATQGGCLDSPNGVDCNNYASKDDVYMSGGPTGGGSLSDGSYFFAVVAPGFQNGGFVDGADGNLSDTTASNGGPGGGDLVSNRTFTLSGGVITYSGTHATGTSPNGKFIIQLKPYDDTPNAGGVYNLAICKVGATKSSQCKYDAFRIQPATPPPPQDLVVTKNATATFTRTYTWDISKDVDKTQVTDSSGSATFNYTVDVTHDSGTDSNWQVTGNIQVTNPNSSDIGSVNVTDAINDANASCSVSGGSSTVPAGSTVMFDYVCTYSAAPASDNETNTATATWDNSVVQTPDASANGTADVTFDDGSAGNPTIADGSVTVTDTLGGTLGTVSYTDPSPTTFTYSHTVTGTPGTCVTADNTATFTTNSSSSTGSDSKSVKLCDPADLQITKNVVPGFTRTYTWSIAKSADRTTYDPGGTAHYTVTVTQTGYTDSAWHATGTITVTNPNDFESISGISVTDAVDNGGTCTVDTSNFSGSLDPNASVDLPYSCAYTSQPAYSATNTATVTWDQTAAQTADGSASKQVPFTFGGDTAHGNPQEVNKCVTVTDSYKGTLGTDCVGTDPATKTFTYSRKLTPPSTGCQTVNNTATIVETNQTAGKSVSDCNSGALTMGFWQNNNGQNIIKSYCGGTSGTSLYTFLTGYNPFKDLTATTCSGEATYVYNVIKAATCTSTSNTCNSMLKAQMLATALDVYFSDPTLGGNKIGATLPIGGLTIDLTSVGSAHENVSSAFGGSPKTVNQMLTYAAGQSNSGGSVWYGQVKATQVLAKDGFDAINNQLVTGP